MGTSNEFKITGIAEIRRAFRELPKKVASKVVRQALRAGLKPLRDDAVRRAPKVSGRMAAAIKVRASTKRKRGVIAMEVRIGNRNFTGKSFYGAFQEFGTKRMPGKHFMEEAFDSGAEQAAATIMRLVTAGIEREAKAK